MATRSIVSCSGLGRLMEINWRLSASSLRYFSNGGRILSEKCTKEIVYIQKIDWERLEKLKKIEDKEKEKAEKERAERKAEEETY